MSRVSDLRDELTAAIDAAIANVDFVAVGYSLFTNEEITDADRGFVRFSNRNVEVGQGIDQRLPIIHVGIQGKTTPQRGSQVTGDDRRAQERQRIDEIDGVLEAVLNLFSPDPGTLTRQRFAEHRFRTITQPSPADSEYAYETGVFVTYLELTFFDEKD